MSDGTFANVLDAWAQKHPNPKSSQQGNTLRIKVSEGLLNSGSLDDLKSSWGGLGYDLGGIDNSSGALYSTWSRSGMAQCKYVRLEEVL